MKLFDVYPVQNINIVKAKESYLWDDQGSKYLDMYGGHAVISIGHAHPHWIKSIQEQMHKISFYSNSIQIPIQQTLADKLGELSNKKDFQLFLCNSGAEANENALKLASFHTGRKKVVAFSKSFHGRTSLAVSATDNPSIIAPVNQTDNVVFLPFNNEQALLEFFNKEGPNVAAVIIECIQGVGGIQVANKGFIQSIRELCNRYDAVMIADEVQSGYGRTGKFFAADHYEINADIYTTAKGMGNGYPVGGVLIAPFIKPKHGMLGTTFGGNHLACAAALAVLEVIEQENLIDKAKQRGQYLQNKLKSINILKNVRGAGLMIGFDVPKDLKTLRQQLLSRHNIFTGEAKPDTIRLLPALTITRKQIDEFLEALEEEISVMQIETMENA